MQSKSNLNQILLSALITLLTLGCQSGKATTYYVSNSGSDNANGRTQQTAWKTISKVNSRNIIPGDSVLFQAGGVWREELDVKPGISGTGNGVYYGRYGNGDNPQILGSDKAETWTQTSKSNVWQSAVKLSNPRNGGLGYPAEIFFANPDQIEWGSFQDYSADFSNLAKVYDWTFNNSTIYIYSEADPNAAYSSVEVPQRDFCMSAQNTASSYIEVNGIDLHYAKISGYRNGYPEVAGATDLTFRNCNIGYIGEKGGTAAYGIEAFHSNFLVENCNFSDCGRRAISLNLYTNNATGLHIKNVVIRNNTFKRGQHTTSLDCASITGSGYKVEDVYFYNNIVDDHEIAMTGNDRTSNQLFIQQGDAYFNNFYIYNNVFIEATARNILTEYGDTVHIWNNTIIGHNPNIKTDPYSNVLFNRTNEIDYRNNILYQNLPDNSLNNYGVLMEHEESKFYLRDYNLYFQEVENSSRRGFTGGYFGYYNSSGWLSYKRNTSWDAHSPSPQNPAFINYSGFDFRITEGSPANGAGTPIPMVTTDIMGDKRDPQHPSIGAYEFGAANNGASGKLSVSLIPNPANDNVLISINCDSVISKFHTKFYDNAGRLVFENASCTGNDFSVPVNNLDPGVYIAEFLFSNATKVSGKFVIVR